VPRDILAHAGFLSDKAAFLNGTIEGTPCTNVGAFLGSFAAVGVSKRDLFSGVNFVIMCVTRWNYDFGYEPLIVFWSTHSG
jgi:hypothetical protein